MRWRDKLRGFIKLIATRSGIRRRGEESFQMKTLLRGNLLISCPSIVSPRISQGTERCQPKKEQKTGFPSTISLPVDLTELRQNHSIFRYHHRGKQKLWRVTGKQWIDWHVNAKCHGNRWTNGPFSCTLWTLHLYHENQGSPQARAWKNWWEGRGGGGEGTNRWLRHFSVSIIWTVSLLEQFNIEPSSPTLTYHKYIWVGKGEKGNKRQGKGRVNYDWFLSASQGETKHTSSDASRNDWDQMKYPSV